MAFTFDAGTALGGGLVALLINAAFVYFAARIVLDDSRIWASLLTALAGTFLAGLVYSAVGGNLGLILAAAVWALVAALFFRTRWVKGAIIGLVAGVLWVLVNLALSALLTSVR